MTKPSSGKKKAQEKSKTFYIYVLKTPKIPWNNHKNGIKLLTSKASSSNSPSIFFAYQCHVDLVFRILTKIWIILTRSFHSMHFKKKSGYKFSMNKTVITLCDVIKESKEYFNLDFGKKWPTRFTYGLNFSFKMLF